MVLPGLTVVACCVLFLILPAESYRTARALETDENLREALSWPWADFPEKGLDCERERLAGLLDLTTDHANVFLTPWARLPKKGPLAMKSGARSAQVAAAIELLKSSDENLSSKERAHQINQLIQRMSSGQKPDEWQFAYHLALLTATEKRYVKAVELMERAKKLLPATEQFANYEGLAAIELNEAFILTHHALGTLGITQAGLTSGLTSTVYKKSSIENCRLATIQLAKLPRLSTDYGIHHGWAPFDLSQAKISSHSIVNNLVVAYLRYADYHYTKVRPSGAAPVYRDKMEFANYRDKIFSRSNSNSAENTLGKVFRRYFQLYYGSTEAWRFEGQLWAISNMIDFTSFSEQSSPDPWFRYNLARLLALEGFLLEADEILNQTDNILQMGHQESPARVAYEQLQTVTSILVGRPVPQISGQVALDPSSVRRDFRTLHPDLEIAKFAPFDLKDPEANLVADQWLFINRWRALLDDQPGPGEISGRFETFLDEHGQLMVISNHGDFFARWGDEVVATVADRALSSMYINQLAGEQGQVNIIAGFLRNSRVFPSETIAATFPNTFKFYLWQLRDKLMKVARVLLLVVAVLAILAAIGQWRALGILLVSGHQNDRLKATEPEIQNDLDPPVLAEK